LTLSAIAARRPVPAGGGAFPYAWRLALLAVTALRLWAAWRAPLSADEAYYWLWSHLPAASYLDHPPMVAVWIGIGRAVAGDTALGVRLLGPISALFGTLLLARAAEDLAPGARAGVMAGVLFNATLVCNAGAVVITPDTPLLFFWMACLAALARLVRTGHAYWWLAVGAAGGLALDSKYTAFLLAGGIAVWLVAVPSARRWWRAWQLWAGAGLALALFAPVVVWNAGHGWVSFAKQGGRTGDWQPAQAVGHLGELLGGQIGLATPVLAVVFGLAMLRAMRGAWRREAAAGLLACVTVLPALAFVQHAIGGRVQANWPAVIYPGAALAAACLPGTGWRDARWWRAGAALGGVLSALVLVQAAVAPVRLPRALDFTLIRLAGWQDLAGAVFVAQAGAGADFVAADEYGLASELAFRLRTEVVGLDRRWAYFNVKRDDVGERTGILVRSEREYGPPNPRPWTQMTPLAEVARGRNGVVAETYRLFLVRGKVGQRAAVLRSGGDGVGGLDGR
jgi:4-amino-4-deoxy-L-arabinose transferase-like glycosyltransferase